eukprot:6196271-Pleurochrysis_carterae.AAC.1
MTRARAHRPLGTQLLRRSRSIPNRTATPLTNTAKRPATDVCGDKKPKELACFVLARQSRPQEAYSEHLSVMKQTTVCDIGTGSK